MEESKTCVPMSIGQPGNAKEPCYRMLHCVATALYEGNLQRQRVGMRDAACRGAQQAISPTCTVGEYSPRVNMYYNISPSSKGWARRGMGATPRVPPGTGRYEVSSHIASIASSPMTLICASPLSIMTPSPATHRHGAIARAAHAVSVPLSAASWAIASASSADIV